MLNNESQQKLAEAQRAQQITNALRLNGAISTELSQELTEVNDAAIQRAHEPTPEDGSLSLADLVSAQKFYSGEQERGAMSDQTYADLKRALAPQYPFALERHTHVFQRFQRRFRTTYFASIALAATIAGFSAYGLEQANQANANHPEIVRSRQLGSSAADLLGASRLLDYYAAGVDFRTIGGEIPITVPVNRPGSIPNPAYARLYLSHALEKIGDLGTVDDKLGVVRDSLPDEASVEQPFTIQQNDIMTAREAVLAESVAAESRLPRSLFYQPLAYTTALLCTIAGEIAVLWRFNVQRGRKEKEYHQLAQDARKMFQS